MWGAAAQQFQVDILRSFPTIRAHAQIQADLLSHLAPIPPDEEKESLRHTHAPQLQFPHHLWIR
jgi:hypothetical protein